MSVLAEERTPLVEALADIGIRPKSFREGHAIHTLCPKCKGGRTAEESLALTIDVGSLGAVWHCHRGSCGYEDNLIIGRRRGTVEPFRRKPPPPVRPVPVIPDAAQKRPDRLYEWFAARGISQDTVDAFGCHQMTHWFGKQGDNEAGEYPAIVFPYRWRNTVVNRKYRGPQKQMAQEKDAQHTLFNIDSIVDTGHAVFVEGETDCLAVHESGWAQVISLKDGAPANSDAKTGSRYDAFDTHAELLQKVERFYLAGDMDGPGVALREVLANRLGRHKCWIVTWPNKCKDACEVLAKLGPDVVFQRIQNAKPYPVEDVQEITGEALDNYLNMPAPRILTTGLTALDQILKLPGEGRLIVITGVPNAGKSQVVIDLMIRLMVREDRRFLVFSPEMQPWEEFATQCAQVYIGKPARRTHGWVEGDPLMSRAERVAAGDWMQERLRFLASDAEDKAPTLDWILERGTESALRLGITDLVIDPWNEVEHQRNGMTETDYTGRSLQKLKAFSYRHGANSWVIAHPTKLRPPAPGEEIPAPGAYDITGSANWANKADIGLTIHTPNGITSAILWKSRFHRWGRRGSAANLEFDPLTGRYSSSLEVQMKYGVDMWSTLR